MILIPEALQKMLNQASERIIDFVRSHVFKSLGTTVAVTILSVFLLVNPWFGSSIVKYWMIDFMISDADDLSAVLTRFSKNAGSRQMFVDGASQAGFFLSGDKAIVQRWADDFPVAENIVDETKLDQAKFAAILYARQRSMSREAPFQPIGLEGFVTSPSCPETRPKTRQIYVNSQSDFGSQFQAGQNVSIARSDGLGRPVIAKVNLIPNMPQDVDIYVNRRQMVNYLNYTGADRLPVRVTITGLSPNQDIQDRAPSEVKINCSKG